MPKKDGLDMIGQMSCDQNLSYLLYIQLSQSPFKQRDCDFAIIFATLSANLSLKNTPVFFANSSAKKSLSLRINLSLDVTAGRFAYDACITIGGFLAFCFK